MSKVNPEEFKNTSMDMHNIAVMVLSTQAMVQASLVMQAEILAKLNGTEPQEELDIANESVDNNIEELMRIHLTTN